VTPLGREVPGFSSAEAARAGRVFGPGVPVRLLPGARYPVAQDAGDVLQLAGKSGAVWVQAAQVHDVQ
jgi:hypothetical protein